MSTRGQYVDEEIGDIGMDKASDLRARKPSAAAGQMTRSLANPLAVTHFPKSVIDAFDSRDEGN